MELAIADDLREPVAAPSHITVINGCVRDTAPDLSPFSCALVLPGSKTVVELARWLVEEAGSSVDVEELLLRDAVRWKDVEEFMSAAVRAE